MQTWSFLGDGGVLRASAWRGELAGAREGRGEEGVHAVAGTGVTSEEEVEDDVEDGKVAVPCSCP